MSTADKFCAKCGQAVKPAEQTNTAVVVTAKKRSRYPFFHISESDFETQVNNHDSLPVTKSARGIAALTMIGLLAFGLIVIIILQIIMPDLQITIADWFYGLIIYVPLIYFTYKGHVWAMVLLGIWYTFDKFASIFALGAVHFNISSIVFWLIGVGPLWIAFRVEREYRKRIASQTPVS